MASHPAFLADIHSISQLEYCIEEYAAVVKEKVDVKNE
jgi:hypothetical protein